MFQMSEAESKTVNSYVITETSLPTSLDPLDADSTQNLPVARMIYATPLEVSEKNGLSSAVLDSFKYDPKKRTVEWRVKEDLKFSDGTPISTEDVAFAVLRMAHARPRFPVIENIVGVEEWAKKDMALKSMPKGIQVNGRDISIVFSRDVEHPLFRFCLELFSIIPKSCVDLSTGKVKCDEIPVSGYYRMLRKEKDSIQFVGRGEVVDSAQRPERIDFLYIPAIEVAERIKTLPKNAVLAGNEGSYMPSALRALESQLSFKFMPAARFADLDFNPDVEPFTDKRCRRFFAKAFRAAYADVTGKPERVEGSIFTKIIPGYLSLEQLGKAGSDKDEAACLKKIRSGQIRWGYVRGEKSIFVETLERTFKNLEIKASEPRVVENRAELTQFFVEGKVAVLGSGSGFWAHDPLGDLKMLFTPNLHKGLQFVSRDHELQSLIGKALSGETDPKVVNQYIHDEAIFNVYAHLRRFFASPSKDLLSDEIPFAITSPAPWQVFRR